MMKPLLALSLAVILAMANAANGQEPVEPLDLRADSILYSYPNANTIEITVHLTMFNTFDRDTVVTSDILVVLGTNVVHDETMTFTAFTHSCESDPDCNDDCVTHGDGVTVVVDECGLWYTWTGPTCDPSKPDQTCNPIVHCACVARCEVEITAAYSAEHEVSVLLDADGLLHEADETNNYCAQSVGTVPTKPSTWGVIKVLFDL